VASDDRAAAAMKSVRRKSMGRILRAAKGSKSTRGDILSEVFASTLLDNVFETDEARSPGKQSGLVGAASALLLA